MAKEITNAILFGAISNKRSVMGKTRYDSWNMFLFFGINLTPLNTLSIEGTRLPIKANGYNTNVRPIIDLISLPFKVPWMEYIRIELKTNMAIKGTIIYTEV
ncbi:MAG: hypothetical protein KAT05_15700 [Spirochaetes bacterium]|nr:hypothetical protein [Spirochaetota bacterium]